MCKILAQLGNCKATLIDNELLKFSPLLSPQYRQNTITSYTYTHTHTHAGRTKNQPSFKKHLKRSTCKQVTVSQQDIEKSMHKKLQIRRDHDNQISSSSSAIVQTTFDFIVGHCRHQCVTEELNIL